MSAALPNPADCCSNCPPSACGTPIDLTSVIGQIAGGFMPFVNVKTYGAKGDGITDDADSIQAAVDAWTVMANGARLYFPRGVYRVSKSILVQARNKDIQGEGFMTWITGGATGGYSPMILLGKGANALNACNNIRISGLVFETGGFDVSTPALQVGGRETALFVGDGLDQPVTTIMIDHVWCQSGPMRIFRGFECVISECNAEGQNYFSYQLLSCGRCRVINNQAYLSGGLLHLNQANAQGNCYAIVAIGNQATSSNLGLASIYSSDHCLIANNLGYNMGRQAILQPEQDGIYIGTGTSHLIIRGNAINGGIDGAKLQHGINITAASPYSIVSHNDLDDANYVVGSIAIADYTNLMLGPNQGYLDQHNITLGRTGGNGSILFKSTSNWGLTAYAAPSRIQIEHAILGPALAIYDTTLTAQFYGNVGLPGALFGDKHIDLKQYASGGDPAAPLAGRGELYFRDNGVGKGQLCVRFPTGAVQVLVTEP